MGPVAGVVAHGGTAGAVVEALLALAVAAVLVAVWVRERRMARERRGELSDSDEG